MADFFVPRVGDPVRLEEVGSFVQYFCDKLSTIKWGCCNLQAGCFSTRPPLCLSGHTFDWHSNCAPYSPRPSIEAKVTSLYFPLSCIRSLGETCEKCKKGIRLPDK
jgi:hypothetical protein